MPRDKEAELFYHVDEADRPLGSITRKEAHRNKEFIHRSVYIVIRNGQNQLLFQKRSSSKDTYPNHWALGVAGHVTYKQTYEDAAVREVQEELGEKVKVKRISSVLLEMPGETEFCTIFESEDLNKAEFNYDTDEISEIAWISPDKINNFVLENDITPDTLIVLKVLNYI